MGRRRRDGKRAHENRAPSPRTASAPPALWVSSVTGSAGTSRPAPCLTGFSRGALAAPVLLAGPGVSSTLQARRSAASLTCVLTWGRNRVLVPALASACHRIRVRTPKFRSYLIWLQRVEGREKSAARALLCTQVAVCPSLGGGRQLTSVGFSSFPWVLVPIWVLVPGKVRGYLGSPLT